MRKYSDIISKKDRALQINQASKYMKKRFKHAIRKSWSLKLFPTKRLKLIAAKNAYGYLLTRWKQLECDSIISVNNKITKSLLYYKKELENK